MFDSFGWKDSHKNSKFMKKNPDQTHQKCCFQLHSWMEEETSRIFVGIFNLTKKHVYKKK
jgi:hypothetical protein